jgi:hypothetical protein
MAKPKAPKPKPDDAEQSKRFEETARELGVDETGKAFRRAVEAIVVVSSDKGAPRTAKKP